MDDMDKNQLQSQSKGSHAWDGRSQFLPQQVRSKINTLVGDSNKLSAELRSSSSVYNECGVMIVGPPGTEPLSNGHHPQGKSTLLSRNPLISLTPFFSPGKLEGIEPKDSNSDNLVVVDHPLDPDARVRRTTRSQRYQKPSYQESSDSGSEYQPSDEDPGPSREASGTNLRKHDAVEINRPVDNEPVVVRIPSFSGNQEEELEMDVSNSGVGDEDNDTDTTEGLGIEDLEGTCDDLSTEQLPNSSLKPDSSDTPSSVGDPPSPVFSMPCSVIPDSEALNVKTRAMNKLKGRSPVLVIEKLEMPREGVARGRARRGSKSLGEFEMETVQAGPSVISEAGKTKGKRKLFHSPTKPEDEVAPSSPMSVTSSHDDHTPSHRHHTPEANSEDDFDLNLTPFSKPPGSAKRRKTLRSVADDDPLNTEPPSNADSNDVTGNGGAAGSSGKYPCVACGKEYVRILKLHKHPRMDRLLVCKKCLDLINKGEFTVAEGHEEYCCLCGDGGELFLCGFCDRSVCRSCATRISGQETLDSLMADENLEFKCYSCSSLPLSAFTSVYDSWELKQSRSADCAKLKKTNVTPKTPEFVDNSSSEECANKSVRTESKPQRSKVRRQTRSSVQESGVEMSSGGESPEVLTDDVDISDDSAKPQTRQQKQDVKKGDFQRMKGKPRDSGRGRRRVIPRLVGSDFESCSEPEKSKRAVKRELSNSSNEEDIVTPGRKRNKISRLLSSGSEAEDSTNKLTVSIKEEVGGDTGFSPTLANNESPFKKSLYTTPTGRSLLSTDSSEEDASETKKTKKHRRAKIMSSRSNSDLSDAEGPLIKNNHNSDFVDLSRTGPRGRRKVLRRLTSDSELSEAEDKKVSEKLTPGKKRKTIRKIKDVSKLDEKTRLARRQEEERVRRLQGKSTAGSGDDKSLVLEESKECKVTVRESVVPSIKPHQKEGIRFLYDACVESLERFRGGERNGAILAHCMGLGKTLQLLVFIDALLSCEESKVSKVLVLSPVNTLYNWAAELEKWLPYREYGAFLVTSGSLVERTKKLGRWYNNGGVLFMGYEMYRRLAGGKGIKKAKMKENLIKYLQDPGPDIVVCDEGHVMRNSNSNLSIILGQIKTTCRIVLTGTPLQNNLMEYYTMVNFVKPNLLGNQREFKNEFVNPIKNGQCSDSLPSDIRKMKQRAHVLHTKVAGCIQRKDYRVLSESLPPKHEYVVSIHLTEIQQQLYRLWLDGFRGTQGAKDLFSTFANLAKVWNHPWVLKLSEERENERAARRGDEGEEDSESSLDGFIVYDSDDEPRRKNRKKKNKKKAKSGTSSRSSSVSHTNLPSPASLEPIVIGSDSDIELPKISLASLKSEPGPSSLGGQPGSFSLAGQPGPSSLESQPPPTIDPSKKWYDELVKDDLETKLEASGKLLFLFDLLSEADARKEKVIVFSQSLLTLDLIEGFLEEVGNWAPGLDYYRLDGSTRADVRQSNMRQFNNEDNDRIRLFLISTRAGSLGVNLVGANRVVIFDACWNPSHDLQAIFRTYRFGQTKDVFVYRLLAQGTMEEKIYDRQVTKESLSKRVVDHEQIGRHYSASDLAELFVYSPKPPSKPPFKRPTEDMALCSILDKLEPLYISGYHEHDSLLEHIYDEELSEEEKKAAWESYKQQQQEEKQNTAALTLAVPHLGMNPLLPSMPPHLGVLMSQGLSNSREDMLPAVLLKPLNNATLALNNCIASYRDFASLMGALQQKHSDMKQNGGSKEDDQIYKGLLSRAQNHQHRCASFLTECNNQIQFFNQSKIAQVPDKNTLIATKRSQLTELHQEHIKLINSLNMHLLERNTSGPVNQSGVPRRNNPVKQSGAPGGSNPVNQSGAPGRNNPVKQSGAPGEYAVSSTTKN